MAKIIFPQGADIGLLKGLEKKRLAARKAAAKAEHANFVTRSKQGLRESSLFGKALDADPKRVAQALRAERAAYRKKLAKLKAPHIRPLSAHNPTRYAPFDMTWNYASGGGLTALIPYGPSATTGQTGYSIGVWSGGDFSTVSSVGFWYYAGSSGSLQVTVSSNVWGRAFVFSALFGYAAVYAGLRVLVERYTPDFASWNARSTIYDNSGVVAFDLRFFDFVRYTTSITVPVRAGAWYAIWGDAVQSAGAGGIADAACNFSMYMGPVTYSLV